MWLTGSTASWPVERRHCVFFRSTSHPWPRHRIRLLNDAAGPRRQQSRVPGGQTQRFLEAARTRPELTSLFSTYRASVPQIFLDVDTQKTMKLGVEPNDVNQTLGAFLGGAYVNDFNRFGRLYKVYVQAEPEYRRNLLDASLFYVRNNEGDMVPISTLLQNEPTAGPNSPIGSICSVPPRSPANPLPATVRPRLWLRSKRSRTRFCQPICPMPGTPCHSRRKRRKAPAALFS